MPDTSLPGERLAVPTDRSGSQPEERPLRPALIRGWRRRCPACGGGPMLSGYLTVRDACPACHEDLHHHRADDGPAYLTILIVGHLMAPVILWAFVTFRPDPLILASVFSVGTVALSLWLLPRLKGAFVALQWAKRMHGFDEAAGSGAARGGAAGS
ncbi:DUF983 domain-containing protein [Frigidibacter oleivorans]|uniref:DUF983 domain-containing protein n=1 Tax=Frigidibacter oleivorans TaxID=2487129 RepID=UPI000F8F030E|nr:DUF983 domain-containing protein [Frigidibacter oleivorans]